MEVREGQFYSDGLKLDSRMYLPDGYDGQRLPLIIVCSGFTGLHQIHPERFARWFTRKDYICFSFDYRGYGESEGPRFRVILEEQVRDIRSAVAVAMASKRIDHDRVFLLGWAMGGGLVIDAARELEGVSGICAVNGLYDGADFQLWHRGEHAMSTFRSRIADERLRRAVTGIREYVNPFDIYPLDTVTQEYVTSSLEVLDAYEASVCSFELAESLLRWSVQHIAPSMRIPLLLVHGDNNALHPPRQASRLKDVYGGPANLIWLDDAGHTEWMLDDHPTFQKLCGHVHGWLESHRTG